MPILIRCPHCQKQLRVPDSSAGKKIRCPACAAVIPAAPAPAEVLDVLEMVPDPNPSRAVRSGAPAGPPVPRRQGPPRVPRGREPSGGSAWIWIAAGAALLVLVTGGVIAFLLLRDSSPAAPVAAAGPDGDPPGGKAPPPEPATVVPAVEWRPFASAEGRFQVHLPGDPVRRTEPAKLPQNRQSQATVFRLERADHGITFAVSCQEIVGGDFINQQVLDVARENAVAQANGKLLKETRDSYDGHAGREWAIETPEGLTVTQRAALVHTGRGYRLYQLKVTRRGAAAEGDRQKFFDSFRRTDVPERAFKLDGQPGAVLSALLGGGNKFLVVDGHGVSRVFDSATGRPDFTAAEVDGIASPAAAALAPDGVHLLIQDSNGRLRLGQVERGGRATVLVPAGANNTVLGAALAVAPGGKLAALSSDSKPLERAQLPGLEALPAVNVVGVRALAFTPDGKKLASAGRELILWDAEGANGTLVGRGAPQKQGARAALAFSADGKQIAHGVGDRLQVYDLGVPQPRPRLSGQITSSITITFTAVAFSRDGKRVAAADDMGEVSVWDAATGQQLGQFTAVNHDGRRDPVLGLTFTPDGSRLFLTRGRTAQFWDATRLPAAMGWGLQVHP